MIRFALVLLALVFGISSAHAQGPQCRTAPNGTTSGYCASEAFVTQGLSARVTSVTCGTGLSGGTITTTGTCATDPAYGGKKLLNTLTAAGSATLSDTTSLTASFNEYDIVFENLIPATATVTLELQVHASGAFQTTSYITESLTVAGGANSFQQNTTFIQIMLNQNNAAPGVSGRCTLFGPLAAATRQWTCFTGGQTSTPNAITQTTSGYWNNAILIDGFRVLFSSGNITSGTIKIYGSQ